MPRNIVNPKTLQKKSKGHQVEHVIGSTYKVVSGSSGKDYTVTIHTDGHSARCSCP